MSGAAVPSGPLLMLELPLTTHSNPFPASCCRVMHLLNISSLFVHEYRGDNGVHVAEASFYDFSVGAGDMVTDRMMFYSNVVNNVTSMTTTMGSNECLDNVLTNDVKIARMGNNETVVGPCRNNQ